MLAGFQQREGKGGVGGRVSYLQVYWFVMNPFIRVEPVVFSSLEHLVRDGGSDGKRILQDSVSMI